MRAQTIQSALACHASRGKGMDVVASLGPSLVVEDDPATRQRLLTLLDSLDCSGDHRAAGSVAQARQCVADMPSLRTALVDLGLPDGNGMELLAWLREHRPEVTCVVVSGWGERSIVLDALRAGAVGYMLKERDDGELLLALQTIARGGAPIDPFVARGLLQLLAPLEAEPAALTTAPVDAESGGISPRETQILRLVAQGLTNREIADTIGLSRLTIESYTKSIYRKLAVGSRTAAVFAARNRGLLD